MYGGNINTIVSILYTVLQLVLCDLLPYCVINPGDILSEGSLREVPAFHDITYRTPRSAQA